MEISTKARRSGRMARVLVNLICLVAIFAALLFIIPAAFGLQRYVITGTSMSGSIDRGSVVFSEVVPVTDLEVGDVITYVPPSETGIDHLVTHRIVAIEDGEFRTKGDAVPEADPWTFELESASQARVAHDIPYAGWIFIGLQDRTVRVIAIGIPAALIALMSLVQLGRALRRPSLEVVETAPAAQPAVTVSG